jgi:hypothetical protein
MAVAMAAIVGCWIDADFMSGIARMLGAIAINGSEELAVRISYIASKPPNFSRETGGLVDFFY